MISKKYQRTVFGFLSTWLAPPLLKGIYKTNTLSIRGDTYFNELVDTGENYILAFWHGQMLPLLSFFKNRGLYTFISPHRDGEYIARALEGLGNHCVRTSLRDQRLKAIGRAIKLMKSGERLAITPDGPVGPGFEAKPGIIKLSEKAQCPILPAVGLSSRPVFFSSWDRFCFPLPLGDIEVRFLEPLKYWETSMSLEDKQHDLRKRLNNGTRKLARSILPDPKEYLECLPNS